MLKLVTSNLPFGRQAVCTANAAALDRLAELLEQGDGKAFRKLLGDLDPHLKVGQAGHLSVVADHTKTVPFQVTLPERLLPGLAIRLRTLASEAEYSQFDLSELEPRFLEELRAQPVVSTKCDWGFRRAEDRPEPDRDYSPDPSGGDWEAVLFHKNATARDLETAWRSVCDWSARPDPHHSGNLRVGRSDSAEQHPPADAFSIFLEDPDAWQVAGSRRLPFRMWYATLHDWIQVWFEQDRTLLIVFDRHAETGCIAWDIENFFLYRALIKATAGALDADRFNWGLAVDSAEETAALPIALIDDAETLRRLFSDCAESDRGAALTAFDARCAAFLTEG